MKWNSSWAVLAAAVTVLPATVELQGAVRPNYSGGLFALTVDGDPTPSFLQSFSGGGATAQVIQTSPDFPFAKTPGSIRFDDFVLRTGGGIAPEFSKWIGKSVEGALMGLNGAVVSYDYQLKARRGFSFTGALLTEIKFPPLDASDRSAGSLTLKLSPGFVKRETFSGEAVQSNKSQQKKWVTSNFRFRLGDLPCERVMKIDGFSVKLKLVEEILGESRHPEVFLAGVEYPDLKLNISAISLKEWEAWYDDFLVNGNNGQDKELKGQIELLAEDMKTVLMTIDLEQVGLKRFNPYPGQGVNENAVAFFQVELYVERMKLTFHP